MKNYKHQKGFTLIELLVVIAIIGVLSSVVLQNLNVARGKARDAQRKVELKQFVYGLEQFYTDNGYYPAHYGESGGVSCAGVVCSVCTGWCRDGIPSMDPGRNSWNAFVSEMSPYMKSLPEGPTPTYWLGYIYTTSVRTDQPTIQFTDFMNPVPQRYCLGTYLEIPGDSLINNPTATPLGGGGGADLCNIFHWGCSANYYICSKPVDTL